MLAKRMKQRLQLVLFVLFFVTGFSGLIYEVLWVRMFTLVFGATVFAVSTVLTAFFTGLALGSFVFGKVVDRLGKPLLLYGLLEVGIGIYAVFLPGLLSLTQGAYAELARQLSASFYVFSLIRFLICFLLILLPTTLMGATLPVLSRFMVEARERVGKDIGYLYAINTIGATLGCLVTGFFLIESLGISRTHTLAVVLNLVVGAVALSMYRLETAAPPTTPQPSQPPAPRAKTQRARRSRPSERPKRSSPRPSAAEVARPEYPPWLIVLILGSFAVSGAAALGYEVLWTRVLGVALQSTTYSFTLILTTFLCGLALGSYVYGRWFQRQRRLVVCFGAIQIAVGLHALGLIHFFRVLPEWATEFIQPAESAWGYMIALQFALCFAVMLIPTLLLGSVFPLVSRICASRMEKLGGTIGSIYAVNSVGAIVGSFLAGFVLIPVVGVKHGMMIVASVNVLVGLIVLGVSPALAKRTKLIAVLATLVIAVVGLSAGQATDLYVGIGSSAGQRKILYYEDGLVANVRVEQTEDNVLLMINNKVQAGRRGARSSQGLGHIPMLLHPNPRRVLTIGMGAGMTAGAVARHPVESVEIVELVAGLAKAAPFFSEQNHDVLNDPRASFVVGDGRNFLLTTEARYDVIVSDIFFPAGAGTGSLYSLEHYQLAKKRLRKGGMMVQWLTLYQLTEHEFKVIATTFQEVFPHAELWLGDPDMMFPVVGLIGRETPAGIDLALLQERIAPKQVSAELVYGDDAFSLLSAFLMGGSDLSNYVRGPSLSIPSLNTDDQPRIEFSTPRNNYTNRRLGWETIQRLASLKKSVVPLLDLAELDAGEREEIVRQMEQYEAARNHFYRGTFALGDSRAEEGFQDYREARSLAPNDAFVDFHTSESIGRLQARLGNTDRAITLLESAVRLRPAEPEPRLQLAGLYTETDRRDVAEQHLAEIVRRHPEHAVALSRLGEIYASQQRWEEASKVLARALGVLPVADPQTQRLYARVQDRIEAAP